MTRHYAMRALRAAALLSLLVGTARAQAADDVLGRAMREELARSMKELRLANLERPYFIAYQVNEVETLAASATAGSLLRTNALRRRFLAVEVRVGDYAFDNSNFFGGETAIAIGGFGDMGPSFGDNELPLDDDYVEIRRKLWLATDAAYKEAAERLAEKRAALLNRARADSLPDFTREPPTRTVDERRAPGVQRADAEALVRELSRARELADMSFSSVNVAVTTTRRRYVNSEGTTYVTSRPLVMLAAQASAQATDGTPLAGSVTLFAGALDSLPARDQLTRQIRLLALRLDSLRAAPPLDRYNGPMLLEGRAAAELFAVTFAPALIARRRVSGAPGMEAMFMRMSGRRGTTSFGDKLGGRVMPDFMAVVDDPTVAAYHGVPLLGGYRVDDEGVPGRRKRIIEAGVLRSLLSTRTPVEGVPRSTGNRRGATAAPSNLIVESSGGVSERELRDRLIALVKRRGLPYGVIVRELGEGTAAGEDEPAVMFATMMGRDAPGRSVLRAYRVYPDGREELVRAGRLAGMDAAAFKGIVAVSSTVTVHNAEVAPSFDLPMLLGFAFAGLSQPVSSYVVPSLLFEDVAMTKPARETPTLPLIPPPSRAPQ